MCSKEREGMGIGSETQCGTENVKSERHIEESLELRTTRLQAPTEPKKDALYYDLCM